MLRRRLDTRTGRIHRPEPGGHPGRPAFGFVADDIPELVIAVEHRYGGHGLGSSLIDAALSLARSRDHAGVSLAVDFGNDRARGLYVKKGFTGAGCRPELGCEALLHRFPSP